MTARGLLRGGLALAAFAVAGAAAAAGLQVAPTSLGLGAARGADGLWLSNTGGAPLHAQVRVFEWTQQGGEDRLAPSRALAVSPPMLALAPGARQLVRVIRLGAPPAGAEAAYRVLVDELPVDEPAGAPPAPGGSLKFVLRYSVPVFVAPAGDTATAPVLSARVLRDGGRPAIEVENRGSGHAQLGNLALVDAAGARRELVPGLLGYVLPGATMRWSFDAPAAALDGGRLQSRINGEAGERVLAGAGAAR